MKDILIYLLEQEEGRAFSKQLKCGEDADQKGVNECQEEIKSIHKLIKKANALKK